jgi:hydroxyacylglutathione hydrolase
MLSAILKLTPHNLSGCALAALTLFSHSGISESWNAVTQFSKHRTSTATSSTCLPMSTSTPTTPSFTVAQFPCRRDNYGFLIHDPVSGVTAAVDTPCAKTCNKELQKRGWNLTHILNTHHHSDHVGGNLELKSQGGVTIIGPVNERDAIPGLDQAVGGGHTVQIGTLKARVIDVGGHTAGHVAYYFPEQGIAFVGDSLFALGCGRMFEGTPTQFWASLKRLRDLPDETLVYW